MYLSFCTHIVYVLLLTLRLSQRRRSPVPPRPRPRWLRRLVGTGRKDQVAKTLAAATILRQVTFSVTADVFRCFLNVTLVSLIFSCIFFPFLFSTHFYPFSGLLCIY
jgi:hypothetical protein